MKMIVYASASLSVLLILALFGVFYVNSRTCTAVNIPKESLGWFFSYKENDILLFRDTLGNTDSLIVSNSYRSYTQCNRFELGEYMYEYIGVRLRSLNAKWNNNQFNGIEFSYSMDRTDSSCLKIIRVFNLDGDIFSNDRNELSTIYSPYYKKDILCRKISIANGGETLSSINRIDFFQWSEEYGLIAYSYFKGEVFHLEERKQVD